MCDSFSCQVHNLKGVNAAQSPGRYACALYAVCMHPVGSVTKGSGCVCATRRYTERATFVRSCKPLAGSYSSLLASRRKPGLEVTNSARCSRVGLQTVFVATEVAPWSKVGGLADVMAALPQSLSARGHTMMTVTPRYQAYADVTDTGLVVPLKLPICGAQAGTAAHTEHQLSDDHSCQQPKHSEPAPLQAWAALYHCRQKGVDRVFVDHPLFLETYGKDNANTYLLGGSQLPNLDLQYSILCQAALAAPILLWHQPQDYLHRLQLQALARKLPRTLSGGVARYIGLGAASASLLAPQDSWLTPPARPPWLDCADVRSLTEARPAMLTGGLARSVPPRPASPGALFAQPPLGQSHQEVTNFDSADIVWPDSAGHIAFVGNDWPCFPLAQHLRRLQSIACESDRGTHAQTGHDKPQASAPLACLAANSFETHMARLLKSARVAFCIHNVAYQGVFAQDTFSRLCLPASSLPCLQSATVTSDQEPYPDVQSSRLSTQDPISSSALTANQSGDGHHASAFQPDQERTEQGALNWLQGALLSSDSIWTVSKSYAHEITHDHDAACGLHHILSSSPVRGIMNGIDVGEWDPETTRHLPARARYTAATVSSGKAAAKVLFQQRYGLQVEPSVPLVGVVGRLAAQKGVDVVLAALPHLLGCPTLGSSEPEGGSNTVCTSCSTLRPCRSMKPQLQLALLGSGDSWMEGVLSSIGQHYPGQACGMPEFSEEAAHLLLAAADYLLVPSRFEPCGLVALYALRYGAVPIAAATGGLRDIVTPEVGYLIGNIGEFGKPADLRRDARALAAKVQNIVCKYGGAQYRAMQQHGMRRDISWDLPAQEWEQTLQDMLAT